MKFDDVDWVWTAVDWEWTEALKFLEPTEEPRKG